MKLTGRSLLLVVCALGILTTARAADEPPLKQSESCTRNDTDATDETCKWSQEENIDAITKNFDIVQSANECALVRNGGYYAIRVDSLTSTSQILTLSGRTYSVSTPDLMLGATFFEWKTDLLFSIKGLNTKDNQEQTISMSLQDVETDFDPFLFDEEPNSKESPYWYEVSQNSSQQRDKSLDSFFPKTTDGEDSVQLIGCKFHISVDASEEPAFMKAQATDDDYDWLLTASREMPRLTKNTASGQLTKPSKTG